MAGLSIAAGELSSLIFCGSYSHRLEAAGSVMVAMMRLRNPKTVIESLIWMGDLSPASNGKASLPRLYEINSVVFQESLAITCNKFQV